MRVPVVVGEGELEIGWVCLAEGVFGELKYNYFSVACLLMWIMQCFYDIKILSLFFFLTFQVVGFGGFFNINFSLFSFTCLLSVSVSIGYFCLGVICPFVFPLYDCRVRACRMGGLSHF